MKIPKVGYSDLNNEINYLLSCLQIGTDLSDLQTFVDLEGMDTFVSLLRASLEFRCVI